MSTNTGIEWTDATWNPIRGCSRVSEGCVNCYAERVAARFSGPGQAYEGLARRRSNGEPQWTGAVEIVERHLYDPLRWKEPRRIFVNSMSDLFHEQLVIDDIAHIFAVMALAPQHTFQVLTKRPKAMREILTDPDWFDALNAHISEIAFAHTDPHNRRTDDLRATAPEVFEDENWPLPNVWLGTSVENQDALHRIDTLKDTPAAVHFVSMEPLLEDLGAVLLDGIEWVIVGGESGPHARPCDVAWIRRIVECCDIAHVPVFVKQLGSVPMESEADWRGRVTTRLLKASNHGRVPEGFVPLYVTKKGGQIDEFPADLRHREFPNTGPAATSARKEN